MSLRRKNFHVSLRKTHCVEINSSKRARNNESIEFQTEKEAKTEEKEIKCKGDCSSSWLAQLVKRQSAVRKVEGLSP